MRGTRHEADAAASPTRLQIRARTRSAAPARAAVAPTKRICRVIFIETTRFTHAVTSRLADAEYAELQLDLVDRPDRGSIIEGSGGIRKLRLGVAGRGKSGGVRVIYYWQVARDTILMLEIYRKNEKADLSKDEVKRLRRIIESE